MGLLRKACLTKISPRKIGEAETLPLKMRLSFVKLLLHVGLVCFYVATVKYKPKVPHPNTYGGDWKFLTYINMWIVLVYFALAALVDILCSVSLRKRLNFLFFSLVMPSSLMVVIIFWTLYSINRELIFPRAFDSFYPAWVNHSVHTLVFFAALLELFTLRRFEPPKKRFSIVLFLFFIVLYIYWMHVVAARGGDLWAYPFLNKMNQSQRTAFFGTSAAFGVLVWRIGFVLHDLLGRYCLPSPKNDEHTKSKRD